jgi:iron complex outermembrane receptor protein
MRSLARSWTIRCIFGGAAGIVLGAPGFGQISDSTRLEEIVVTATRRTESLQDVPMAVTAITGEALANAGVARLEDLATQIPNTFIDTSAGLRATDVAVRGISSNPNNPGVDPAVGVFVDGVYQSRPTTLNSNLYDLERIEVVRGPQGALYGKNTIAGAVNFITRLPTEDFQSDVDVGYGNYNATNTYASASGSLGSPSLLGRVSASWQKRDGDINNLTTGTKLDNVNEASGRLALLWKATDFIDVILRADKSRDRTNDGAAEVFLNGAFAGTPYAGPDPATRNVTNDRDTVQNRDIDGASIQIDARFGAGTLTSLTSYQHYTWYNLEDDDSTALDILSSGIQENQTEWAEDLRFVSKSTGSLNYIAGAYFSHQTLDTASTAIVGPALGIYPQDVTGVIYADVTTQSEAVYGQLGYDFTDRWNATLSARYSHEWKEVGQSQIGDPYQILLATQPLEVLSRDDSKFTPAGSLTYRFSKNVNGYASISNGFKAGGFNVFSISPTDQARYEPETVTSYELGLKSLLADDRVRLNTAIYYLDYKNLQVNQLVLVSGTPQFTTSNAATATSKGAEIELNARVTAELGLNLSYGYCDAVFKSFPNATAQGANYSGYELPDAAKNTVATALDYAHPLSASLEFMARADFTYRSGAYFQPDNTPNLYQGGYGIAGARLGVGGRDHRWGVNAWVRNISNRMYALSRTDGPIVPGQVIESLGLPRMYGVDFHLAVR